jgi:hypothetical protein
MWKITTRKLLILIILVSFSPFIGAQDRTIPLDMYLIIDGSQSFQNAKNDAVAWLNSQVIDRILMEGDTISIWSAGESSGIIHSGQVTGGKTDIKDKLQTLKTDGKTADFSGALREAASRGSQTPQSRLSYTMLITASAEGLEAALTGSNQGLFRWSRSERYERWQVLIVAPDIAPRVRDAAASYMNAQNPRL